MAEDVFPPDFSTSVGRVRKYIPDTVQRPNPEDPTSEPSYYFSDAEIQSFVDDLKFGENWEPQIWDIKRAAASVIIAMAINEGMVLKKITTEDLQTDGPALTRSLLFAADRLKEAADDNEAAQGVSLIVTPYFHNPPRLDWR